LEAILAALCKPRQACQEAGTKEGGQSVLDDIFYVIGGHIIKPLTF